MDGMVPEMTLERVLRSRKWLEMVPRGEKRRDGSTAREKIVVEGKTRDYVLAINTKPRPKNLNICRSCIPRIFRQQVKIISDPPDTFRFLLDQSQAVQQAQYIQITMRIRQSSETILAETQLHVLMRQAHTRRLVTLADNTQTMFET